MGMFAIAVSMSMGKVSVGTVTMGTVTVVRG